MFAELGYHDASIVKITEAAGVGQGTFYLYFASKKDVFDELVVDLNHRVRHAMTEAASQGTTRAEMERLGFAGYFRFVAEHPALYRIIRQAEFVSPEILQLHYERLTSGYVAGLRQAMEDGEIADGDPELLAWALMGIGELVGMRWILWNGRDELPAEVLDELGRIVTRTLGSQNGSSMTRGRAARDSPLPPRALDDRGGGRRGERHPGGRGRREVRPPRQARRGRRRARERPRRRRRAGGCSRSTAIDPASIGALVYYGSTWKDYPVWQAAPWIAHRLGCDNAYAIEYDNVSMGTPVALRFARALLTAEPELGTVLLVAACRESYLLDYGNERSRFMFNFGDGAVAGLLAADADRNLLLGCHAITDGSFSLQVKVPAGGSVEPASHATVDGRRHFLDVADPAEMKGGLDEVSLPNFVAAAEGALARSGATRRGRLVPLRDPHEALDARGDRGRARRPARARRVPRRHRAHERRRPAARARPGGPDRRRRGRRSRPAARRRYRLHLGGERRTLGRGRRADEKETTDHMSSFTDLIGKELGPTEWLEVDQERIDRFADATGDHQWIHVDPERAAEGPFGTTIAHGYLTLSLLPI